MSALALALGGRRLGLYQQAGNGAEAKDIKLLEGSSPLATKTERKPTGDRDGWGLAYR